VTGPQHTADEDAIVKRAEQRANQPGRRGDRVSFQDACNRFISRQGSRTASTAAKKSPSIASQHTLPRIIPVPQAVTCRRSWFASRFD